jgi:hypothetical protein
MSGITIQAIKDYDATLVKELLELEQRAFPPGMQFTEGEAYYADCLKEEANINIIMRNNEGKVIGYVVAMPQSSVYEILKRYDPDMEDDPERFYVETIQTFPGQRQAFGVMRLLYGMCEEAEKRGFNKFSMHARKLNGLSDMILKVSITARRLRTIENWYGYGEPFDYIELTYVGKRR